MTNKKYWIFQPFMVVPNVFIARAHALGCSQHFNFSFLGISRPPPLCDRNNRFQVVLGSDPSLRHDVRRCFCFFLHFVVFFRIFIPPRHALVSIYHDKISTMALCKTVVVMHLLSHFMPPMHSDAHVVKPRNVHERSEQQFTRDVDGRGRRRPTFGASARVSLLSIAATRIVCV